MHNNYFFLQHLSKAVQSLLQGSVISECFSQNKEELIVRFESHNRSIYLKANLQPSISCLSFPETFSRARKNSVDLFPSTIGRHVVSVTQFDNERSFSIDLTDHYKLLFKLHATRSNILVFSEEEVEEIFRNNIDGDSSLTILSLNRTIDWSFDAFVANQNNLKSHYFTFGKVVWQYLESLRFYDQDVEGRWSLLQQVLAQLNKGEFYITSLESSPTLSLLPFGQIESTFTDPVEALNAFFYRLTSVHAYEQQKAQIAAMLRSRLNTSQNYINKTSAKLREIENDVSYKVMADVLMANLHAIPNGASKVALPNFYQDNAPIDIKLKQDISPQKNAEIFYRKSKNQQIEIQRLRDAITQKQEDITKINVQLTELEKVVDLKALKAFRAKSGLAPSETKEDVSLPFFEFDYHNFKILVGKNAASNDILTFRYGYKEDLWLHAKDVTGSHVLIKHQSGKNFPKEVIERAAQLAAYNSKRKTETLCPVIVTPRKFVRKRKGDPAGAVVVEREEVILVEPKLND